LSGEPAVSGRKPPELALRVVSSIVLIAVTLAATWQGGAAFALLCAAAAGIVLFEYLRIVRGSLAQHAATAAFAGFGLCAILWFVAGTQWCAAAAATGVALVAAYEFSAGRRPWAAFGLAYCAAPFMALALLRATGEAGAHLTILLFAAVWATDIFAYFAGRTIGGPKLAPAISPNKTWSGAIGGLAGAAAALDVALLVLGYPLSAGAILLAVLFSIVSQVGDLVESWVKRRFGVKDSGAIIPGHGGLFDRIDGLILAAIAAWLAGWLAGGQLLTPGSASQALLNAFVLP